MFDLDNIEAVDAPENDLEEVVMGLIINSDRPVAPHMLHLSRPSRAILPLLKT